MTKIKSFAVGLAATELKRAVEWYRQLLGEVEEVNPAPGVWEFQIVPSGCLQFFESEINEPNRSILRFEPTARRRFAPARPRLSLGVRSHYAGRARDVSRVDL